MRTRRQVAGVSPAGDVGWGGPERQKGCGSNKKKKKKQQDGHLNQAKSKRSLRPLQDAARINRVKIPRWYDSARPTHLLTQTKTPSVSAGAGCRAQLASWRFVTATYFGRVIAESQRRIGFPCVLQFIAL